MTTISLESFTKLDEDLINGIILSLNTVVPIQNKIDNIHMTDYQHLDFPCAVLLSLTGDVKGNMVLAGDTSLFQHIAQSMFGMPLEGEMLSSFRGELANMIAGGLATNVANKEIYIDITSPTIMDGETIKADYQRGLQITTAFDQIGNLEIYMLLNDSN